MPELIYRGDRQAVTEWLKTLTPNVAYVIKAVKYSKKRTLDQNAQSHVWYSQISDELREDNIQGWTRYCKLHHGIPILRSDDVEFKAFYDKALLRLTYQDKLEAMDFVPVTRLMNTEQFSRYFTALQDDFLKRGVKLEFAR